MPVLISGETMNSLTIKLAGVFVAISLIPLIIGVNGTLALQTADMALNDNNRALQNLSQLLVSADQSLSDNIELQTRAETIIDGVAAGQQLASNSLQNMAEIMLPRSFAVSRLRFALAGVYQAERALLLALNMRHLVGGELQEARQTQYDNLQASMGMMEEAKNTYLSLVQPGEDMTPGKRSSNPMRSGWKTMISSWKKSNNLICWWKI